MANTNNDEHEPIESATIDEHKPNVNSSEALTESLGFESLNEKSKSGLDEHSSLTAERTSRSNTTTAVRVTGFPPLISSLKKNGRPRFSLVKMREHGRLQILCVKNTGPDVYVERTPPADDEESGGRVRVKFIDGDSSSSSGNEQ